MDTPSHVTDAVTFYTLTIDPVAAAAIAQQSIISAEKLFALELEAAPHEYPLSLLTCDRASVEATIGRRLDHYETQALARCVLRHLGI